MEGGTHLKSDFATIPVRSRAVRGLVIVLDHSHRLGENREELLLCHKTGVPQSEGDKAEIHAAAHSREGESGEEQRTASTNNLRSRHLVFFSNVRPPAAEWDLRNAHAVVSRTRRHFTL